MNTKELGNSRLSLFYLRKMWKFSRGYFGAKCLQSILRAAAIYAAIWLPKLLLDSLGEGELRRAFLYAVIYASALFLTKTGGAWLGVYCDRETARFCEELVTELSEAAMRIPYSDLERFAVRKQYELAKKCIDRDSVSKMLQAVFDCVFTVLTVSGILFILSYLVWWLWIVLLISVLVEVLCETARMRYHYESYESQSAVEMSMCYFRDWMPRRQYAKEIRLYGMLPYVRERAKYYIDRLASIQKTRAKKTFAAVWWSYLMNGVLIFFVYAYMGFLCLKGVLGAGSFVMSAAAALELNRSALAIARIFLVFSEEGQYMQAFGNFLRREAEGGKAKPRVCAGGPPPVLRLEHVAFRYDGSNQDAVRDLNLTLEPGKHYGVVGPNGSGKSTFIKLLMGLYIPTEGVILCDGTDIQKLDREEYWKLFSVTFQDFWTFDFSVERNIAAGAARDVRTRCEAAAKAAGIWEKIVTLPGQLDADLGKEFHENGAELSGGEKQKLALARMIYKDAPVWILDEPTAALSPQSEYELYAQVGRMTQGRTMIFISHRMASCRFCDEVLVFDRSGIVQRGSHEELMAEGGLYRTLFETQAKYYDENYQGDRGASDETVSS